MSQITDTFEFISGRVEHVDASHLAACHSPCLSAWRMMLARWRKPMPVSSFSMQGKRKTI